MGEDLPIASANAAAHVEWAAPSDRPGRSWPGTKVGVIFCCGRSVASKTASPSAWQPIVEACAPGQVLKHACGSPCYAAPEMLTRQGQANGYVGHPVDIWSMGVTLFAMICGFLPFEHANTSALYKKIIAGEYVQIRQSHPRTSGACAIA